MKITIVGYEDLPEIEKENQPDNGHGKEYASYLKIEIDGKDPDYYSDAMEPEDARFSRDLSWIKDVILKAHLAGKRNPVILLRRTLPYLQHLAATDETVAQLAAEIEDLLLKE